MTICFYPWLNVGLVIYESLLLLDLGDTDTSIIDGATNLCTSDPVLELMIHQTCCLEHPWCLLITYQDIKRQKPRRRFGFVVSYILQFEGGDMVWPLAYHHLTVRSYFYAHAVSFSGLEQGILVRSRPRVMLFILLAFLPLFLAFCWGYLLAIQRVSLVFGD